MKQQFSYYAKIIINILAYVLFFAYLIYFMLYGQIKNKVPWMIICVVFGLLALLYEIIKTCYDAATKRLVFDGLPDKTLNLLKPVEKLDIFKNFRTSVYMMRQLAHIDLRQFDELKKDIEFVESNEKVSKEYDVALITAYSKMIYYGEKKDLGKIKTAYHLLLKIRDTKTEKGKTRKSVYFLNWNVVDGMYQAYTNNYSGAYNALRTTDTTNMNRREAMHYRLFYGIAAKNCNYIDIAKQQFDLAIKDAAKNQIMIDYINEMAK